MLIDNKSLGMHLSDIMGIHIARRWGKADMEVFLNERRERYKALDENWFLLPRTIYEMRDMTGLTLFHENAWELIDFCPSPDCGRPFNLVDVGCADRFCAKCGERRFKRGAPDTPQARTAYLRPEVSSCT